MYQKRERAQNYAKSSIPKPRVVTRNNYNDKITSSSSSSKNNNHIKTINTENVSKVRVKKTVVQKSSSQPKKEDPADLDNLLDYMLKRHASEQSKLKSMD